MFRCPSDFTNPQPTTGGATNYHANKGASILWQDPVANGVIYWLSSTKISDITDGTSQTAVFSERNVTDGSNGISTPDADTYLSSANPLTMDEAVQMCKAVDVTNLANQFPQFMGAPWMANMLISTSLLQMAVHVDSSRLPRLACRQVAGILVACIC